ncbi:sensor histidine kinase [Arthrobacter cryoconiti]|uniref:histidine kinase n=1 Tax=Arthrobacter cryoconiti TaxID=748907 RepID=A0ABV8R086_9MICC|nr:HAMP domain-containing sensor histidine kinase [Arthrobacter cryoconiti]MCC9069894.1 HAMP domain-containing histidine kinase [Arthrobacter cryoconiti]
MRFRLAIGFALIAVLSAGAAGGITIWSARDNILEAEQNRVLSDFQSVSLALPYQLTIPANADAPKYALETFSSVLHGPVALDVLTPSMSLGNISLNDIPASFRLTKTAGSGTTFARTTIDGKLTFIVGESKRILLLSSSQSGTQTSSDVDVVLYARYPLMVQKGQIDQLTSTASLLSLLVGLVAALIGVLLSRGLLRPVTALRAAVENLGVTGKPTELRVRGVSELSEVIRAFNDTSTRLHQAMAELSESEIRARRFVADVSHELRTPTAAMVASADVLDNPAGTLEHRAEAARLTASAARRLAQLTGDLLEISKFDAGQIMVQPTRFDVAQRLRRLHAERAWPDGVEVALAGPLMIESDLRRFDVIVSNLLSNALAHGKEPVIITGEAHADQLELRVHDCGGGIDAEDLAHLFDRFYKSDRSRSRGGTGLGLSLVKENVVLIGGSVSVASATSGTTFTLRIPSKWSARRDDEAWGINSGVQGNV